MEKIDEARETEAMKILWGQGYTIGEIGTIFRIKGRKSYHRICSRLDEMKLFNATEKLSKQQGWKLSAKDKKIADNQVEDMKCPGVDVICDGEFCNGSVYDCKRHDCLKTITPDVETSDTEFWNNWQIWLEFVKDV